MEIKDIKKILKTYLGDYKEYKNGDELVFYCFKCNHRKKKLYVTISKQLYNCFVCGFSGKGFYSLLKAKGVSNDEIKELLNINYNYYKNDLIEVINNKILNVNKNLNENDIEINIEYNKITKYNYKDIEVFQYYEYLIQRGLTLNDIELNEIGYINYGELNKRVIIPSKNKNNKYNYFVARTILKNNNLKYINAKINKSKIIFFENKIDWNLPIILCEGVFDALKIKINAIPLLGKFIGEKLLNEIKINKPNLIYIYLDNDALIDAYKLSIKLDELNIKNKIVFNNIGKDAGELTFEQNLYNIKNNSKFVSYFQKTKYLLENKIKI